MTAGNHVTLQLPRPSPAGSTPHAGDYSTLTMSLIRGALELQNIHSLAGPFNCDRVRTPSPKDNLIIGVCFIPITYSVIIFPGWRHCSPGPLHLLVYPQEVFLLLFPHLPTEGRVSPIFVSAYNCCNCLSRSPPMNSRFLFASPCIKMAPLTQHLLWAPMTLFFCALHPAL